LTRRAQIIHLILFLSSLVGISWAVTGSFAPPTGDASIWLHCGLLMVVLGMYWIEPYFTKPADVVINGLVVYISTSMLTNPPYQPWWLALRYMSLGLIIVAFAVVWAGSPAVPKHDTSRIKRLFYLIVVRIGNAKILFSAVFFLALLSYFDLHSPIARWLVVFWGVLLVAKHLELEGLVDFLRGVFRVRSANPIGQLSRFAEPDIVRFQIDPNAICRRGRLVAFTSKGFADGSSPLAIVIGHRTGRTSVEAEAVLVDSKFAEGALDNRRVVTKVDRNDPMVAARLSDNAFGSQLDSLVGFASQKSDIGRLRFELNRGTQFEEGHLVSANSLTGTPILFQLINGILFEEPGLESGERAFTIGEAQQLGTWDTHRQGFSAYSWVVPENALVFRHSERTDVQKVLKPGQVDVGHVPNSSYPVNITLADLVLYHSAILGVTGSGKSFLAYFLLEQCAAAGVKVLCLDLTGDYRRYIHGGVRLKSLATVAAFLDDTASRIGIVEFTEGGGKHPITATKEIARATLDWCRTNRTKEEIREPTAKVLLVIDEAHSLVPEWNSNPVPSLRDTVNSIAQIALQARKYGLGFMVVTQRTANVTKSILNQCNTIFAFQAYDETGFEFMKNYMGFHYVQALPNLKKRQGVVVGKSSVSDRPVIVRFHDQDRQAAEQEVPFFESAQYASNEVEGA